MAIPDGAELRRLQLAAADDPDRIAAFEQLVTLIAARDEAADDMQPVVVLDSLEAQISAAWDELRWMLGEI